MDGEKIFLKELQEWWYGWAFYLPPDFYKPSQAEADAMYGTSANSWITMGGTHTTSTPDTSRGYTDTGASFTGLHVNSDQELFTVTNLGSGYRFTTWEDDKPIKTGVWHTIVIGIGAYEKGWSIIYLDDVKVYENRNINLRSHSVDVGGTLISGYRHNDMGKSQYVIIDEIRLASNYENAIPR